MYTNRVENHQKAEHQENSKYIGMLFCIFPLWFSPYVKDKKSGNLKNIYYHLFIFVVVYPFLYRLYHDSVAVLLQGWLKTLSLPYLPYLALLIHIGGIYKVMYFNGWKYDVWKCKKNCSKASCTLLEKKVPKLQYC